MNQKTKIDHRTDSLQLTELNDFSFLHEKKVFLCGGCELNYIKDYFKQSKLKVYHTFENGRPSEPIFELKDSNTLLFEQRPDYIIFSQIQSFMMIIKKHQNEGAKYLKNEQLSDYNTLISHLSMAIKEVRKKIASPIFILTHLYIQRYFRGIHEFKNYSDKESYEELLNLYTLDIYRLAKEEQNVFLIDSNRVFEFHGKKIALELENLAGIFEHPSRIGAALLAQNAMYQFGVLEKNISRIKCAVFDLDNTLWKGVLREDGVSNLCPNWGALRVVEALISRGILVCINSKNDEEEKQHLPGLLGEKIYKQFVLVILNWLPKSQNIKQIAKKLNIGIDSIAFFDDNPSEREEVRKNAPEVKVFADTDIIGSLDRIIFEPLGPVTTESETRTQKYKQQAQRIDAQSDFQEEDLSDFLKSCKLELWMRKPIQAEVGRIEELIQRTNQLNAAVNRTNKEKIIEFIENNNNYSITVASLKDKFGDYGLIGLVVFEKNVEEWKIQELTFSCRAMGKQVENALLANASMTAQQSGCKNISINFKKTSRNKQMFKILNEFGFAIEKDDIDIAKLNIKIDGVKFNYPDWFSMV